MEREDIYIATWRPIAETIERRYGIPVAVSMAQAIIESGFGSSDLSTLSNNHFGVKCFKANCVSNHCVCYADDRKTDRFRRYDTGEESWLNYARIISGKRYSGLLRHGKDYSAWFKGLQSLGYATNKNYAKRLIAVVKKYNLDK